MQQTMEMEGTWGLRGEKTEEADHRGWIQEKG